MLQVCAEITRQHIHEGSGPSILASDLRGGNLWYGTFNRKSGPKFPKLVCTPNFCPQELRERVGRPQTS